MNLPENRKGCRAEGLIEFNRLLPDSDSRILRPTIPSASSCRLTQLGLLRLLATSAVTGKDARTIGEAWKVHDLSAHHQSRRDCWRLRGAGPSRPRPTSATIIPYNTRPATGAVEIQK